MAGFFGTAVVFGASGGTRTHDPLLRRQLLYPLSYGGDRETLY